MGPDMPGKMMQLITGSWVSQCIGAAARLGVADHLLSGPKTGAELATACGASADYLTRLMRMLSSVGVFAWSDDRFALTPLSEMLRSDVPGSMRYFAISETDQAHWQPWGRFYEAVKVGQPMAREALGMDTWDYYGQHPDQAADFTRSMHGLSQMAVAAALSVYDFSRYRLIADIGGAHGAVLAGILQANPSARGILLDLPHVVRDAGSTLAREGIADRVDVVAGDFFASQPTGPDLYLFKHILHDWSDDKALAILATTRAAMKPGATVLLIEFLLPTAAEPSPAFLMDMNMMVVLDGRERSEADFAALLARAGLTLVRVVPTPSPFALIEARPA